MSGSEKDTAGAVALALQEAKRKGLPQGWSVQIDKRKRRKWIAPNGKTCDSIPKALAISIELGLLPPDTPIPVHRKKKRPASSKNAGASSKKKAKSEGKPAAVESESESGEESDPGPESDPETSLDIIPRLEVAAKSTRVATVHWDPDGPQGRKVGWKIRIWDDKQSQWRDGRIIRYDPYSHKHKIHFEGKRRSGDDEKSCLWLRLSHEVYQCATRLVWAHVKGFAWWPGMVMECDPQAFGGQTAKEGYQLVSFFGSDEVATLKDSPECVRPFQGGKLDPVIAKHKKKRNANAFKLACQEEITIRDVRNEAVRFYAEKAFKFSNKRGSNLLGKRIQLFRSDVNYPYGDTVVGIPKQYNVISKKFLLSFEISDKTGNKYDASWINLLAKGCNYKLLDKKKPITPSLAEILPYVHGFQPVEGTSEDEDTDSADATLSKMMTERCRGCVDYILERQQTIACKACNCSFHVGCIDTQSLPKTSQRGADNSEGWLCAKCTVCRGCKQCDIVFGAHPQPAPASLSLEPGETLNLCSMCITAYEKQKYCPNCALTWNDVKYEKVKSRIESSSGKSQSLKESPRKRDLKQDQKGDCSDDENALVESHEVDPSWLYPETSVWGYTEGTMLICDGCSVWVHAGCGGLTEEEYETTSNGDHPIYSKEFLCRSCCQRRCNEIITALQSQDKMHLFALPVSLEMAPTYHDVIKSPMDLQTMSVKATKGGYLNYAWVRDDFELMVFNALTFNRMHTKLWGEAKRYYKSCMKEVFRTIGKAAPPGAYTKSVEDSFTKAELAIQLEVERVQEDDTVEKKDLVAGSEVAVVKLPALREPVDQPSCVSFTEVKLKPLDAYFYSWMDCCFICGSSGSLDTLLFCVDCGESFHSFCASAPIHSMEASSVSGWRCPNCKICEISGEVPQDDLRMLFCEMCDRGFSLDLLEPPLDSAPPGLWICGQCVDCKHCGNRSEKDGVSLKHWSQDPEKCYRCGGCDGLGGEKSPECPICHQFWRAQDNDLVQCSTCQVRLHAHCDVFAAEATIGRIPSARQQKAKYDCPTCRKKHGGDRDYFEGLRKDLHNKAWMCILDGSVTPDENTSFLELHDQLQERIDWEIRDTWHEEYVGVISEGLRVLDIVKKKYKYGHEVLHHFADLELPQWMGQRAARFMRLATEKRWEVGKFPHKNIIMLTPIARMAASFLKVACRAMGMKTKKSVMFYDRMTALLKSPGQAGFVDTPMDIIRIEGNENVIQAAEWNSSIHPNLDLKSVGLPTLSEVRTGAKPGHGRQADPEYILASPLCGWNTQIDASDQQNQWKDPRECCLCHMCGDDDAGFAEAGSIEKSNDLTIARVGRLLPMPDGLWVHASCALWSSEVYEAASGGLVHSLEKARSRGSQLKCFGCGRSGATVGCFRPNCSCNYHFPCAKACGGVFTSKQQMFCSQHKGYAPDVLPKESFEYMKTLTAATDEKKGIADKDQSDAVESGYCLRVGCLIVHSLGVIDQKRDGFHTENYIYPAGYMATRIFWSARTPRTRTVYVLKIDAGRDGHPVFSITPGDEPDNIIRGESSAEVYSSLMKRVKDTNRGYFTQNLHSKLPVQRRTLKKTFGLNGPQFFGIGLDHVRKALETCPGAEALAAPLSKRSVSYRFCFSQPSIEAITDLQRRRAAVAAERALENSTGCARTEGMKAMVQSGGSGRITRALVRNVEEEAPSGKRSEQEESKARADRESNQRKYQEMKSVPIGQRLAARRSHIHGWGLFCKIDLPKDAMIVEYMGETVRRCIADKREKAYEISGEGSCYMFRLDLQRIVDATVIGCMARFMNHCCKPNAYAKVITVDTELGPDQKIVVFANQKIAAGEEITYDYKFPVEDGSLKCTCGAPNCIGRMN